MYGDIRHYFDGEINLGTEINSIAETSENQSAMFLGYQNPNPLPSVQPQVPLTQMSSDNLGSPLVSVQPQVPLTQMANENLGSSDDGRTYLALQAQQDTWVVMIKAMYGKDTKLLFPFPVASGIIGLKGEVSKRLDFEVDSFDIKYMHKEDLISIRIVDDLTFYLNAFKPLDNSAYELFVISKTPNYYECGGSLT